MDVPLILRRAGLSDQHFSAIGSAISEGYAALSELSKTIPMLQSAFLPGHRSLGVLRNIAVQHALSLKAAQTKLFRTDIGWNAINNHAFLKLKHRRVQLTVHYLGRRGTRGISKAIYRSELQMRNRDLFEAEKKQPDVHLSGEVYAQIVHGGLEKPTLAAIRIPNRDYLSRKLSNFVLQLVEPSQAEVEQVRDRIAETIRKRKYGKKDAG